MRSPRVRHKATAAAAIRRRPEPSTNEAAASGLKQVAVRPNVQRAELIARLADQVALADQHLVTAPGPPTSPGARRRRCRTCARGGPAGACRADLSWDISRPGPGRLLGSRSREPRCRLGPRCLAIRRAWD